MSNLSPPPGARKKKPAAEKKAKETTASGRKQQASLRPVEHERDRLAPGDAGCSSVFVQTEADLDAFVDAIQHPACSSVVMTAILAEPLGYYLHTLCDPITAEQKANLKSMKRKKIVAAADDLVRRDGDCLAGVAFLARRRGDDAGAAERATILPFGPFSHMLRGGGAQTLSHISAADGLRRILSCGAPVVCFRAQALQCVLRQNRVDVPRAGDIALLDPALMTWLDAPELRDYTLRSILEHYGLRPSAGGAAGAGERVLAALSDQRRLADFVRPRIADMREALDRETWIASLLAAMEATGFALMPHYFEELAAAVSGRIHEINGEANALLGRAINLASHAQVSEALFKTLGLEVPELRDHNKNSIVKAWVDPTGVGR